jgi:hypothetical protein
VFPTGYDPTSASSTKKRKADDSVKKEKKDVEILSDETVVDAANNNKVRIYKRYLLIVNRLANLRFLC